MKYCEEYYSDLRKTILSVPGTDDLHCKKILITGATGLICSGVVDLLHTLNTEKNAGIEIIIAGRSAQRTAARFYEMKEGKDYRFAPYDATKPVSFDFPVDYIIHGACSASPAAYVKTPVEIMESNIIGIGNLLKYASDKAVKRVLYISSSEVYGKKEGNEPYKEDDYGFVDILNARAPYPSSKRAAETLLTAYGSEYGTDAVIVRPGHIYGPAITPSDDKATAQFTRNAVKGEPIIMKSAGMQLRSYTYFLDCASAVLTVLLKGEKGNAYNVSNPDSVITISRIAELIADAAGMKIKYEDPTATEAAGYNLMSNSSLDASKLLALGWKPLFCAREGAKKCVRLYF